MNDKTPKRLRYLRERKGLAQKYVAEKIGVKNNTLSGYESGRREPDSDTLSRLADFYEVTTDFLLGRSDEPSLTEKEYYEALAEYRELIEILEHMPEEKRERNLQRIRDFVKGISEADK